MDLAVKLTPKQLPDFLLHVAPVRPVFIWGPPGIGKSAGVEQFAAMIGYDCETLMGSQLAPEDVSGVPRIEGEHSRFCPPVNIARKDPYCLFLDELNGASHEVMKAFYPLIHGKRVGNFQLHPETIIIGAGNRMQDSSMVKALPAALINRMIHVELVVSHRDWLEWAGSHEIHPWILEYIGQNPHHLHVNPPKTQEPFSTPRSWHVLSDAIRQYGDDIDASLLSILAQGALRRDHATNFQVFIKMLRHQFGIHGILKGDRSWPRDPAERDVLYFLAQSFRGYLSKELPGDKGGLTSDHRNLAHSAKKLLGELAGISLEMAQMVVAEAEDGASLPGWFLSEIVRDLPRLAVIKDGTR